MKQFVFGCIAACSIGAMSLLSTLMAQAQERVVVSVSTDSLAFLPFFVANAMNYFEEVGLEVEPLRTGSGSTAMAALLGGNSEMFIGSTPLGFAASAQGMDVKIIGALINQFSSNIVVSREWADQHGITEDSPAEEKLAALRGIRIGVTGAGSGSDQIVRYLASEAGLDPERDMTIVGLGSQGSTLIAAMSQNRIDAFAISPPTPHIARDELGAVILFNTSVGEVKELDGYFYIGLMALEGWLSENPDTAVRFLRGLQMALTAFHDPELTFQARDAVHAMYYSGIEKSLFDVVWEDVAQSSPETVEVTRDMLEQVAEIANAFSSEQIDMSLLDEVYTNEYASRALLRN